MSAVPARPRRADHGFTLVEILVAIVLVGILSAVVVVGIGNLTSKGTSAGCTASKDAAAAGATTFWGSTGSQPTTFTQMTSATPPALSLPSGATVDVSGLVLTGSGWTLTMIPGLAGAAPTFLCSTDVPAGFTAGPNGHFYRFVPSTIGWSAASAAASSTTFNGQTGYLATITSAAEQNFVYGLVGTTNSAWLGGTDAAVEGVWRWSGGPEAGQQFSTGAASFGGAYVRWPGGQPDDAGGTEECLHIYQGFGNTWNDVPCNWPLSTGYVVEIGV
jgi:prepilin-type N-terminal cleavage/methylation domain-containing protein